MSKVEVFLSQVVIQVIVLDLNFYTSKYKGQRCQRSMFFYHRL